MGEAYNDAFLTAYWHEGRSIADEGRDGGISRVCGALDKDAYLAALDDPQYQQAMLADVAQAQAYGLNAVPALVLADQYLISGAQPYETLCRAVEQIQAEINSD